MGTGERRCWAGDWQGPGAGERRCWAGDWHWGAGERRCSAGDWHCGAGGRPGAGEGHCGAGERRCWAGEWHWDSGEWRWPAKHNGRGGDTKNAPVSSAAPACTPDGWGAPGEQRREGCAWDGCPQRAAQERCRAQGMRAGSVLSIFRSAPAPLTAVEALLLQQRAEDLALQGAEVPQAAQLLRQLRVGQRQVHPAAGTARSPRAEHPGPRASSTLPAPGTVGAPKMPPNRAP